LSSVPKQTLRELKQHCQSIGQVPASWAPAILRTSSTSLLCSPRHGAGGDDDNSLPIEQLRAHEGEAGVDQHSATADLVDPPKVASVPLGFGALRGSRWSVGVSLQSQEPGKIGDGCLIGVEVMGTNESIGRAIRVCFSPSTGRCFIMKYPTESIVMVAQVMSALEDGEDHGELSQELEAWLRVTAAGGISFHRRYKTGGAVEQSGELPRSALPAWATDYCASISFLIDKLQVPTSVSVLWAALDLPPSVASQTPDIELDAVWSIQGSGDV